MDQMLKNLFQKISSMKEISDKKYATWNVDIGKDQVHTY